jgi:hypothetical protein
MSNWPWLGAVTIPVPPRATANAASEERTPPLTVTTPSVERLAKVIVPEAEIAPILEISPTLPASLIVKIGLVPSEMLKAFPFP